MKIKSLLLSMILLLPFFLISCEKEKIEVNKTYEETNNYVDVKRLPIRYSTSFDWENTTQIQTASGVIVSMPWLVNDKTLLPSHMLHNHPRSEGWELVYNTLDKNDAADIPTFFALYNKYMGIMRLFYIDLFGLEPAEAFFGAVCIRGTTSLLNFEGRNNKKLSVKKVNPLIVKSFPGDIEPTGISNNKFVPLGSFVPRMWYVTEIEFVYENISHLRDDAVFMQFIPFRGNHSNIVITGQLDEKITGTLEVKTFGTKTNVMGGIGNIFNETNYENRISIVGSSAVNLVTNSIESARTCATQPFWNRMWNRIQTEVPDATANAITSTLTTAINQGIKWATNPLSAFLCTVLSIGASNSKTPLNKVDLTINPDLKVSGSITPALINSIINLRLPNTIHVTGGPGYPTLEMKNWNLGVWNVEMLPVVQYDISNYTLIDRFDRSLQQMYSYLYIHIPDVSPPRININPRVKNDCLINIKIEYIIETACPFYMNFFDQSGLTPFEFKKLSCGKRIQSYIIPTGGVTKFQDQGHFTTNVRERINVYARITLVLTHKTTGQEFVHIKNFPMESNVNRRNIRKPL